jgi:hypothetical protein
MAEMAVLPSFTAEQKLLIKKALYYDFMLFNRNQKPFNEFLRKSRLKNSMYTSSRNVAHSVESGFNPFSSMIDINRYEKGLHDDLLPPNRFNPIDNVNLKFIIEGLRNPVLDQSVFNPDTLEQIDQGIKALVANLTPGAPLYNCSTDVVMSAIMAGRFDEFLSEENKEDMKQICYSGANPVIPGPGIKGEEVIEFPRRTRALTSVGFGGKKKCSKIKSKSKKTKKRSKSTKLKKTKRGKSKNKSKKGGGRVPAYVGSIQGNFTNIEGRQLFTNPVGGIA